MSKAGLKGNVEALGAEAQKEAIRMKVEGLSHRTIADELNQMFNADLTMIDVQNFVQRQHNRTLQIVKEDENFQNKLAEQYYNTVDQLKKLNAEMWDFFYKMKTDPEYKEKSVNCPSCGKGFKVQLKTFDMFLKTADHLLNQLKHMDTVLGKTQNKTLNITYNYTDLSQKLMKVMPQLLNRAEKQGAIKIKKRRLKELYVE